MTDSNRFIEIRFLKVAILIVWSQRGGFHIQSNGEGLLENQWQIVDVVLLIPRLHDAHLHSRDHIFVKYSVDEMM